MFIFELPEIGEAVVEGEIVAWLVKEGDAVAVDQPVAEIMTDKATVEISSPKAGRIARLHGNAGDVIKVHAPLVDIAESGSAAPAPAPKAAPAPAPVAAPAPAEPALPTSAAGGRYVVNVGSFSNLANARTLADKLRSRELPADRAPLEDLVFEGRMRPG